MTHALWLMLAWIILLPYTVWVLFLAIMSVYRAHLAGTLPLITKRLARQRHEYKSAAWLADLLNRIKPGHVKP